MSGVNGWIDWIVIVAVATAAHAEPLARSAPDVKEALAAKHDVWGELSLGQPNGPSYAFFKKLLPPLRYVDCAFRHYPIALASPLGPRKARLISNGSGVNAPSGSQGGPWYDYPLGVTLHLGEGKEIYGSDLARLTGPSFADGYLPIVQTRYSIGDATLAQEAFVPVDAPFGEVAAVMLRLSLPQGAPGLPVTVALSGNGQLELKERLLVDRTGGALLWLGEGWEFNAEKEQLTATIGTRRPLLLTVFSHPLKSRIERLDGAAYAKLRANCVAEWERWIARCMNVAVPEDVVDRAWKSLVIANLMMATGDEMSYSAGNVYQRLYEAESGDAARALMIYGLIGTARAMTNPLLRYAQEGLTYHDAAFKLQLLAHVYWITRDAEFIRTRRELWRPAVNVIVNSREMPGGLLPKENYCGDIATQVHTLNSNANAWRGLRDIAAVLRDMGEQAEAEEISAAATEFRRSILEAIEKSERRDVEPTFIPVALFGAEQPHEAITESRIGSYWNLMIPYVLGSGILDGPRTGAVLDYLHTRGGVCMGMIRFHQHSGLFANENGIDDLYGLRYTQTLLKRDDVDRALVSFYGKLAQGLTRDTFVGGEGTGLIPEDPQGRPMYLPPNAAGNAMFLTTLRELLVQDQDLDSDGEPETLRLLFATPRAWLEDGKVIQLENAPTAFGPTSVIARSKLSCGEVVVDIVPPPRSPDTAELRLRLPDGWSVSSATAEGIDLPVGVDATVDVSNRGRPFAIRFLVRNGN